MTPEGREAMRAAGRISAVGMEFAAAVIICLLLGYWADGKLGTGPYLTIAGILLGSFVGFRAIYSAAKTMQKQAEEDLPPEPPENPK
jgi:ATP synthase protein I